MIDISLILIPPFHAPLALAVGALSPATPGLLTALGVLLITIVVFNMLRRRLRHRPTFNPRAAIDRAHDARVGHQARRNIEEVMVEAEELVRRLAGHLDNKSARIEKLIRDADDRLARLSAATPATITEPHDRSRQPPAAAHADRPADPVSGDVFRLADEGLATIEIAQQLSEGVGKVELILALRDN